MGMEGGTDPGAGEGAKAPLGVFHHHPLNVSGPGSIAVEICSEGSGLERSTDYGDQKVSGDMI
jgi:hypothetical protein